MTETVLGPIIDAMRMFVAFLAFLLLIRFILDVLEYINPEEEVEVTNGLPRRGPGCEFVNIPRISCLSGCSEVFKQLFSNLG